LPQQQREGEFDTRESVTIKGEREAVPHFPNLMKISPVQQVRNIIQQSKVICIKVNGVLIFLTTRIKIHIIFVT
jgi:hypothetical protein